MRNFSLFIKVIFFWNLIFQFSLNEIAVGEIAEKIHPVTIFKHFDEVDGLTTKMFYSIIQDADGFMWFATDAGIFRYDGKTFRHFTVDDGLTDNEILQLYQDRRGRIWFLTLNGYPSFWFKGKIHNGSNTPFLKNAFLGNSLATAYEDRSGKLWLVGLKSGLMVIDDTLTKKFLLAPEQRMWGSSFIYEDEDEKIWYFYKNTMVNVLGSDSLHFTEKIYKLSQSDGGGPSFLCLSDGLYKIEKRKFVKKIN